MGSLIEELRRREDAARAEADRLRSRIEELSRDLARAVSVTDLLLDGFATRMAVGYPPAVPLLRAAVAALFTGEQPGPAGIPATILGWFAADDLWDDQGRRAMLNAPRQCSAATGRWAHCGSPWPG